MLLIAYIIHSGLRHAPPPPPPFFSSQEKKNRHIVHQKYLVQSTEVFGF